MSFWNWYLVFGAYLHLKFLVFGIWNWYLVVGSWYLVVGSWYLVVEIYALSGISTMDSIIVSNRAISKPVPRGWGKDDYTWIHSGNTAKSINFKCKWANSFHYGDGWERKQKTGMNGDVNARQTKTGMDEEYSFFSLSFFSSFENSISRSSYLLNSRFSS